MALPIAPSIRQGSAQGRRGRFLAFAKGGRVGQSGGHAGATSFGPRLCLDCTPFPSVRPAQQLGWPDFLCADARASADAASGGTGTRGFSFREAPNKINCATITTLRGTEPCGSILSFLSLRPPAFRAALPRRPSAVLPAPSPVRPSPMPRMKTWSLAPRWAAYSVRPPVVCRACRPAPATDMTAACGRHLTTEQRPSGRDARVAFAISAPRPGRGARGERCSRRS